jgi:hypothetical protein
MSAFASSYTVNCTPFPLTFNGGVGSGTVSCPGFSSVGIQSLDTVSLNFFADYQFGTTGANDIKVTFAVGNPAGVGWSVTSQNIDVTGGLSSSGTNPGIPVADSAVSGVNFADFANAFNVGISSAIMAGGAATSSGAVSITYSYTPIPTGTPEPVSMLLLGSGLVGVAVLGRKFARK